MIKTDSPMACTFIYFSSHGTQSATFSYDYFQPQPLEIELSKNSNIPNAIATIILFISVFVGPLSMHKAV